MGCLQLAPGFVFQQYLHNYVANLKDVSDNVLTHAESLNTLGFVDLFP
jgi:hypothetical protein